MTGGVLIAAPGQGADLQAILSDEDLSFLSEITTAVLEASRVPAGATVAGCGPNITGDTLIRPGGRKAYPAFWIRDYAMSLEAKLITLREQRHMLFLTVKHQPDTEIVLPTGSVLPPGSIPDHVAFGDIPIFFPGVWDEYKAQGGPQWGKYPCLDDQFFFVHMAAQFYELSGDSSFLKKTVNGKSLLQRLEAAYAMPPSRTETGIVYCTAEARGVNFGFFDTTVHTGNLLFSSLLKYRAALELVTLCKSVGEKERAARYRQEAKTLCAAIESIFCQPDGWLRASTGRSAQPDVWGTEFAVYTEALSETAEQAACQALAGALRVGTIAWQDGIRHVPTDRDFSATSAWETSYAKRNRYQNGAYWNTPVGWVCYAAAKVDYPAAQKLAGEYIAQLRADDFRKGLRFGAPWECMHPEENHRQNPVYLTSASCPLAAFQRMTQSNRVGKHSGNTEPHSKAGTDINGAPS